jgi:hypothetical protein
MEKKQIIGEFKKYKWVGYLKDINPLKVEVLHYDIMNNKVTQSKMSKKVEHPKTKNKIPKSDI